MKGRTAILALLAGLLPAAVGAQQFEGTVTYRMSMGPMNMDVTQYIKGNRFRQEMASPMGTMVTIMDTESGKLSMQIPGQPPRTMDLKAMQEMGGAAGEGQAEITAKGTSETVAGHTCEHYSIKQGEQEVVACIAQGMGFVTGSLQGPDNRFDWAKLREQFKDGFFPLKITSSTPQGEMVMEAVSLERKSLSDDLFQISG